jgi:hypothetical protein
VKEPPIRDVSLREMLEAMAHYRDDETFRWYQTSKINARGEPDATDILRVSMGQARQEVFRSCLSGYRPRSGT